MKEGFYLSPDGSHIIELEKVKNKYYNAFNIEGFTIYGYMGQFAMVLDFAWKDSFEILFSSWECLK